MKKYSSLILRIGIGLVIIWFGTQQLINPASWYGFLPTWTNNIPVSHTAFIYLNGWFEVCFGILLILGLYTKIVAGLLTLHLLGIVFSVGYSPIGVRDFGLTIALLSIFLSEENWFSMHKADNLP